MKIRELNVKNFGKLKDTTVHFTDGINVVYGENESGKSTIHTFIKSMLFGLERGRGRAANSDVFSQYEPWENPNYYAGILRFESGGKVFCIERNFDKYAKSVKLFCQNDGEELSIEDGDLDMLLDDISEGVYDNTISIGQLHAEPGQPLSVALKNYATNCYTSGGGDLDQSAAIEFLKKRRKEIQREIDLDFQKKREKKERLELEASYVWRDILKLEEEHLEIERQIEERREKEKSGEEENQHQRKKIRPLIVLLFLLFLIIPFRLITRPWNYLVAIIVFLGLGNYIWSRLKVGRKQVKTESEKILEEISGESESLEKLIWEMGHVQGDLKEKRIQYDNLREQSEELEEVGDYVYQLEQKKLAVSVAEEKLHFLAEKMQEQLKDELNEKASSILAEITDQKYTHINIEETLKMNVICEGRSVGVERLSRGTLEQIYFSIRMAASDLLRKEELPVILDDTFVYYDDIRLSNTLKWLDKNRKQVLLFTCQQREEDLLKEMGINYKTWRF